MKAPDRGDEADRIKRLEKEVEFLQKDRDATQRRLDKALAEIERLRKELEEALRSLKRQAAPFSKVTQNLIPRSPAASLGLSMASERRGPFQSEWIKKSRCRCPKKNIQAHSEDGSIRPVRRSTLQFCHSPS